jgi:hypothetical protein
VSFSFSPRLGLRKIPLATPWRPHPSLRPRLQYALSAITISSSPLTAFSNSWLSCTLAAVSVTCRINGKNYDGWISVFALRRQDGVNYYRFGYNANSKRWLQTSGSGLFYRRQPKIDESILY